MTFLTFGIFLIILAITGFAAYCVGYWHGEMRAGRNYRTMAAVVNGTHQSQRTV
jgi:hypothetical protein